MKQSKNSFRHESLQDNKTIRDLLKAITSGVAKGKVVLSDEDGEIVMKPEGLLHLKVTASQEDAHNRLNIRISWQSEDDDAKKRSLKVSDK